MDAIKSAVPHPARRSHPGDDRKCPGGSTRLRPRRRVKSGSDEIRDSPTLDVAQILPGIGTNVTVFDPASLAKAQCACPELRYAESVAEAARDAQVVLLLADWPEFAQLSPDSLSAVVAERTSTGATHWTPPASGAPDGSTGPWRRHRGRSSPSLAASASASAGEGRSCPRTGARRRHCRKRCFLSR